jgi:rhodanese-related sulfurtransferase
MVSVSENFKTINVAVGSLVWVIKYGDDLKLAGAEKLAAIPKEKEVGIKFRGDEKTPYAVSLSVKQPARIAPEKLVSVDEMSRHVDKGPAKGGFTLVDSRPAPRYNEGHLPYAVSMPNDKFDTLKDKILPKEKDSLVIFYCAGPT